MLSNGHLRLLLWDLGTRRDELNEPLGIEELAGVVAARLPMVHVRLHWTRSEADNIDELLAGADVVGLSAKAGNVQFLDRILAAWDNLPTKPLVVIGNMLATLGYEEVLHRWPHVVCVLGEGESAITGILQAVLAAGGDRPRLESVPNLVYADAGGLRTTNRRQEVLTELPLPQRDFLRDTIAKGGIVRVEASRGCEWCACTFCCIKAKYGARGWRPFRQERIVADLASISEAGGRRPYFTDEDFFGPDMNHVRGLCAAILEAKSCRRVNQDMRFFVSARPGSVLQAAEDGTLDLMKEVGFREVFIGIESGSPSQLQRYGKRGDVPSHTQSVRELVSRGIDVDFGFILFDPEMTLDELKENIQYLDELSRLVCDARPTKDLRVQPFTHLHDKYQRLGILKSFDLNKLEYPWSCEDKHVGEVLAELLKYDAEDEDDVYRLQAATRGEVSLETQESLKDRLCQLRALDWELVKSLVARAAEELSPSVAANAIERVRKAKHELLSTWRAA